MSKHSSETETPANISNKQPVVAIIGNPNCGKSTLFNTLTGIKQKVGNWPGVTIDRREGCVSITDSEFTLIDLPGVYNLDIDRESLDEQLARDYIMSGQADALLIVADAANLERSLYLISQLLESGTTAILALNMMDVAKARGMEIDIEALSESLGCPVIPMIARQIKGINELKKALQTALSCPTPSTFSISYPNVIQDNISKLSPSLATAQAANEFPLDWLALQCLEGYFQNNSSADLQHETRRLQKEIFDHAQEDADTLIAASRYQFAHDVIGEVVKQKTIAGGSWSDKVDKVVLNDYLGLPFFLLVIYLMFSITINYGGALIDFFDITAGALFIDGMRLVLDNLGLPHWIQVLFADGLGGGIQVVATFIPIIATLYLCLSIIEDSGYMARAAFVMDRFMRKLGLPGKAFVPLIVGFGCNVPSIMAARTLEKSRERILTVMMAPFMSCGARLSVYALFAAAFFPQSGQNIVFLLYIIGILAAIFTALLLKTSVLKGESDSFLIELPAYHLPSVRNVLLHTWERLKGFIMDAGKFIVLVVMAINILNSIGLDGSFGNENSSKSVLSEVSKTFTPVFKPMGIEEENWPAIVGIFTGLLAKEVVVGTLDAVYTSLEGNQIVAEDGFSLIQSFDDAISATKENLSDAYHNMGDPLGLRTIDTSGNTEKAAEFQDVSTTLFGTLVKYFDGKIGAFSYLLFILLYVPCVAALAAIKKETGTQWMLFSTFWSTFLAYSLSVSFYQVATFSNHPTQSSLWVSCFVGMYILIWLGLRHLGDQWLNPHQQQPSS